MKKHVSISSPGRLTLLAALLAGIAAPLMAAESSSTVVISQVYGGGGNSGAKYTNDFIELFNRSSSPVSLAGMSVQYAAAGGTSWTNKTDLNPVTLQPGQYYLIQESSNAAVGVALPTPDQSATIAMAVGSGKVALVSNTTVLSGANPVGGASVLDLVGYGAATGFEGSGPTGTVATSTTSAQRLAQGCTDTDNNATDFATVAVAPRNSGTTPHSCVPSAPPIVATCNAFSTVLGVAGSGSLSAVDADSIVDGVAILSGAPAGITLGTLTPSSAAGQEATVALNVAASTAAGAYPVVVNFTNNVKQETSCKVIVTVQGLAEVTHKIYEIQGAGASSPYPNSVQTTEGVVTAKLSTGFFIQDAIGDNDPTTSDAIYVYTGSVAPTVAINDIVRVTATVQEYTPTGAAASLTELVNPTAIVKQGTSAGITPTNITLPLADFGPYQGMLVRFAQSLTASQVEFLGDRGEISLSSGRLEVTTNRYRVNTPEELALRAANARNLIVLDDGIFVAPPVIPYIGADKTVRAGDSTRDLTGVIDLNTVGGTPTKSLYKLQPTQPVTFSRDNPRPSAPGFVAGNVKVASANVLNFFTTFTNGASVFDAATTQGCSLGSSVAKSNCRGADNLAEFTRQRDKIVNSLKLIDADVVGLMEIQNNGETAVTYLVDQLNAAYGVPTYAVVPKPSFSGTDAIRVAMIYKPSKLTLSGAAITDPDPSNINNRAPMAQTFVVAGNGGKFSLIVNHLKSKGSCPASGDIDLGEGCFTNQRKAQTARLLNNFIPQVQAAAADMDVLLIGDFNAYGMESPITQMTDAGIVNELERFVRPSGLPYSYVFGHSAGYIDHALTTPSMSAQVVGASEFHNNADEPSVIDYNLDGKTEDLYVNNAYRASDHDPVTITLNVAAPAPTFSDVTASFAVTRSGFTMNRVTLKYTGTLTFTNNTGAAIQGPFQVRLDDLSSGVTLDNKSGDNGAAPYITVSNASLAPGEKATITTTFSNPSKGGIGYTTKIFTGKF
ncbi:ExeM/NucH family extracellular endonuclease [Massilia sp. PWRC2]|uniref:ExeM/NucH family extracellular endonuclease n=1 Tax=Massilia sp. PWRC2 TaxID=2804626 RepID=UPI003CF264CF